MTDYDQREELHAALGDKMMGASINGNASGSNPLQVGSNPTPPATSHTVALIRMGDDGRITYGGDKARLRELVSKLTDPPHARKGCRRALAGGQFFTFCGETDMGHTLPVLCTECGGTMRLA